MRSFVNWLIALAVVAIAAIGWQVSGAHSRVAWLALFAVAVVVAGFFVLFEPVRARQPTPADREIRRLTGARW
jgi:uncharacterized membrane protein YfcA